MKLEFTTTAYATSAYAMRDLMAGIAGDNHEKAGENLSFSQFNMDDVGEWVKVGTARITVDLLPVEDMQSAQLAALKAKLQEVRAENQQRENAILDAISKLQALEYVEAA